MSVCVSAQDAFVETLEKAERATPHEAIYILSDYQQFFPDMKFLILKLNFRLMYFQIILTNR